MEGAVAATAAADRVESTVIVSASDALEGVEVEVTMVEAMPAPMAVDATPAPATATTVVLETVSPALAAV
jgi:hypothetical protein